MGIRIAIDTGGTFTDLVLFDSISGTILTHKVQSTPEDPGVAMVKGIFEILNNAGQNASSIEILIHGTTVATNTVIQRTGARTAFLTTSGFRDILHIQRQDRPLLYDLRARRAEPLVPRSLRFEITERLLFTGEIETPLDRQQVHDLSTRLHEAGIEAVAVGYLHSYANHSHEKVTGEILQEHLPDTTICLSHELVQEESEYERFSTCAMNAYVQPVMSRYLSHIDSALSASGIHAPLYVMKSNGGVMDASEAASHCVHTILSGPAGGVVAGREIAHSKKPNLITADMGGTSFDVAIIHNGEISFSRDSEIERLAIKAPMLDIHTVGAGGGSIGWIDSGGSLRVGPHSAGAVPGPACYGNGGDRPTVTDANLVLGRLSKESLLGGGMALDESAGRNAIQTTLADPLNMSVEEAAEGIIRIVNATMTAAIRKLTVERGHDPRSFALCPFGGAGPLHGTEIAREMGLQEVIIPASPGVTSAVGLLMSDLREDYVITEVGLLNDVSLDHLTHVFGEIINSAKEKHKNSSDEYPFNIVRKMGLRYYGQGYDIPVEIPDRGIDIQNVQELFHKTHERIYGFRRDDQPVELVTLWVSVTKEMGRLALGASEKSAIPPSPVNSRRVYFSGQWFDTPVFRRDDLKYENAVRGPAVIEQLDSTTLIWPGQHGTVDGYNQLNLKWTD